MDMKLKRGTDRNFAISVTKNGDPVNITGWAFRFTVKNNVDDADADAIINKLVTTFTNAAQGKANLKIAAADTNGKAIKIYHYDIKFKDASNNLFASQTGYFELVQEITDTVN